MEPARETDDFTRRITVADSNNIVAVLDMNAINSEYQIFESDYVVKFQVVLEDLKVTVGLFSLAEAPWPDTNALMSESTTMAEIGKIRTQGQKISLQLYTAKGNGSWVYQSKVVLMNQGGEETHVPILVPFLSTNETLLVGGNFKLGVRVEPIWNQPLKTNDYLVIKGTWRQIVSFSKKKDDDVEALTARIAALELALQDRLINLPGGVLLGRNGATGTVQQISQSQFATPTQITAAINALIGNSTTALDTLAKLGAALANDASFAATITNALALKANLFNSIFLNLIVGDTGVGGIRLQRGTTINSGFMEVYKGNGTTRLGYIGFNNKDLEYQSENNANHVFGGGNVVVSNFTTLGDNVAIKLKRLTGTTAPNQGGTITLNHGLIAEKIVGIITKVSHSPSGGLGSDFDTYPGGGYAFDWWHDSINVSIMNAPSNSQYILSVPFSVLIFYIA